MENPNPNPNRISLGPKSFGSSMEMFEYFYKLLHSWSVDFNFNKYEHLVLMELLEKGEGKSGDGICGFQVRYHPVFRSRCFFFIREDDGGSAEDFSFRKCIHHLIPLPDNMLPISDVNQAFKATNKPHGSKGSKQTSQI